MTLVTCHTDGITEFLDEQRMKIIWRELPEKIVQPLRQRFA